LVGDLVGDLVGVLVGDLVGDLVGVLVGVLVGDLVGNSVHPPLGRSIHTWKSHASEFDGIALSYPDIVTVVQPIGNTSPLECVMLIVGLESQASLIVGLKVTLCGLQLWREILVEESHVLSFTLKMGGDWSRNTPVMSTG
jgi:hypothetical protein